MRETGTICQIGVFTEERSIFWALKGHFRRFRTDRSLRIYPYPMVWPLPRLWSGLRPWSQSLSEHRKPLNMWNIQTELTSQTASTAKAHLTSCLAQETRVPAVHIRYNDLMIIIITSMQEDNRDKVHRKRRNETTTTCIPLSYLCGDFWLHLFSHGSRAAAAATSLQSSQEDRKGEQ